MGYSEGTVGYNGGTVRVQWGYSGGTVGVQCTPISAPQRRREYTWIGGGFKSSMLPRLDTQSVTSILSVEILG